MKKILKIAAIVIGSLALLIGGYLLYITKFKEYDVADTQVDEIVREPYVIEMPEGGTLEIDEEGNVVEKDAEGNIISEFKAPENAEDSSTVVASSGGTSSSEEEEDGEDSTSGSSQGSSSNSDSNNSSSGSTGGSSSNSGSGNGSSSGSGSSGSSGGSGSGSSGGGETSTMTVADIKAKYDPVFAGLEAQAEGRLASLVSRAKAEYTEKQANGESIDYGYFYRKYSAAAANLEAATDAAFYSTLAVVQNTLVANGFNKSYAADYESQYKARKAERRSELMSQVTGG
ncbi:hypothetical protein [Tetzosporium hominis]|uniref:hypothetical protein n=1 Tax=Tetzosporium hominis TaxID=2020506 RepID=UPI000D087848|nr:hypothetical protein [Tetzosporium hominis]